MLQALSAQRRDIRLNWEALLRLERPSSPLANPDTLVHLLDRSLEEIFRDLALWSSRAHPHAYAPQCPCGLNPWLAYLDAGRQALRAALIDVQVATPGLSHAARDEALACLEQVLDHIARREIESFCAVCQSRPRAHRQTSPAGPAHHAHQAHP
ncbi:hypothetical protein [Opitutus sp. GAS368]|uniref:hypothetical protein n=1 Tax=Opitutus sp. GAS368 TaxID=1882749 RepID=UPI00087956A8|nr:hypothetical protein [Opitutus sp. GAS368]SDS44653.1 hypothetical protein SAMN05444173_2913 [Opitutus sp. GAS368]